MVMCVFVLCVGWVWVWVRCGVLELQGVCAQWGWRSGRLLAAAAVQVPASSGGRVTIAGASHAVQLRCCKRAVRGLTCWVNLTQLHQELLASVAPKKANWDLKREVQPKLDKLERRTLRALVDIMQQEERRRLEEEGGVAD